MPAPLATAIFIFAAFLLTINPVAAVIIAGVGVLVQAVTFIIGGIVSGPDEPQPRVVTLPREFDTREVRNDV
jgi:hypothetical protein